MLPRCTIAPSPEGRTDQHCNYTVCVRTCPIRPPDHQPIYQPTNLTMQPPCREPSPSLVHQSLLPTATAATMAAAAEPAHQPVGATGMDTFQRHHPMQSVSQYTGHCLSRRGIRESIQQHQDVQK